MISDQHIYDILVFVATVLGLYFMGFAVYVYLNYRDRKRHEKKQLTSKRSPPIVGVTKPRPLGHEREDRDMTFTHEQLAQRAKAFKAGGTQAVAYVKGIVAHSKAAGEDRDEAAVTFQSTNRRGEPVAVRNPFWSIRGEKKAVDPIAYYGNAFVGSEFVTLALDYLAKAPRDTVVEVPAGTTIKVTAKQA